MHILLIAFFALVVVRMLVYGAQRAVNVSVNGVRPVEAAEHLVVGLASIFGAFEIILMLTR